MKNHNSGETLVLMNGIKMAIELLKEEHDKCQEYESKRILIKLWGRLLTKLDDLHKDWEKKFNEEFKQKEK